MERSSVPGNYGGGGWDRGRAACGTDFASAAAHPRTRRTPRRCAPCLAALSRVTEGRTPEGAPPHGGPPTWLHFAMLALSATRQTFLQIIARSPLRVGSMTGENGIVRAVLTIGLDFLLSWLRRMER